MLRRPVSASPLLALLLAFLLPVADARAAEGMWTFDNLPAERMAAEIGFVPDAAWIERARLASVRVGGGCSGSFVSRDGLVMTNHHCIVDCLSDLTTAEQDLIEAGFLAPEARDERACPGMEIFQLVSSSDVTPKMAAASAGIADPARAHEARRFESAALSKACSEDGRWRCEVVELYQGGLSHLYKYRVYRDVRLVFAPESDIAYFGGDPDNFEFPRYDLDVGFVRAWEGGKPAATPTFFPFSDTGANEGDPVFVTGHPHSTDRLLTVAQVELARDVGLPATLLRRVEQRGLLSEYASRGPEQRRAAQDLLWNVENAFKARLGRWRALFDPGAFGRKVEAERVLRERVGRDPALVALAGTAWDEIARAVARHRSFYDAQELVGAGQGFDSTLFTFARHLLRAADERGKPDGERLEEYQDAALPGLEHRLLAAQPVFPEVEVLRLRFALTLLRERLGPDDPRVKTALGKESPDQLARRLVGGTTLADPAARKVLWEGGKAAVDASADPMITFARRVDTDARALRRRYEAEVEEPIRAAHERIARVRFAVLGTEVYPDATGTLRLSYGQVRGWTDGDRVVPAFTTLAGAFERATGADPYELPRSWIDARDRLPADLPFNFVTTNDIIGGNSGSPLVDRDGRIVGLAFDGNIHSLAGEWWFDERLNRCVAVDSRALLETLGTVYRAERLAAEIRGAATRGRAGRKARR